MSAQVNGIAIPEPMASRGRYTWQPPAIVGRNGRGAAVTAPYAKVTWAWPYLTLADYEYWITDVLGGAASIDCTAILVDHLQTSYVVTCTVLRPTYSHIAGGLYRDVELQIDQVEIDTTTGEAGYWLGAGRPPTYSGD